MLDFLSVSCSRVWFSPTQLSHLPRTNFKNLDDKWADPAKAAAYNIHTFIVLRELALMLWKNDVYLKCLDSKPQLWQFICSKMSIPKIVCAIQPSLVQSQDPMQLLSSDSVSIARTSEVCDRWRHAKITLSTSEASFICPCKLLHTYQAYSRD